MKFVFFPRYLRNLILFYLLFYPFSFVVHLAGNSKLNWPISTLCNTTFYLFFNWHYFSQLLWIGPDHRMKTVWDTQRRLSTGWMFFLSSSCQFLGSRTQSTHTGWQNYQLDRMPISWARCKSAFCCRQITTSAPHCSVFTGRMPFLSPNQQRQSTEGIALKVSLCHVIGWIM